LISLFIYGIISIFVGFNILQLINYDYSKLNDGFNSMIIFFGWFLVLFTSYFLISFLYLHFSDKKALSENIVGFGALFMVLIHILLFLILMFQDISLHPTILPLWLTTLGLPIIIFSIIILFSSLFYIIIKFGFKSEVFARYKENMTKRFLKRSKIRNDIYRKLAHVLIFITFNLLREIRISKTILSSLSFQI